MSTAAQQAAKRPTIEEVLLLLNQALAMLDQLGTEPEFGARLQHVIDDLDSAGGADPAGPR